MDVENDQPSGKGELTSRPPGLEDLLGICRELNLRGARYVVVGGFATRAAGYIRETMNIDFVIDAAPENEANVFKALEILPDKAVRALDAGDVARYTVVRVADEIVVDLMQSACGIDYAEASKDVVVHDVSGVPIPFASPRLLWRMKKPARREKDAPDLFFLREWFRQNGGQPPEC